MTECQTVYTDLIIEFIEVAINNVLFSRKLYPEEAFVEKKIYSTATHVCQHPEVSEYVQNVLKGLKDLMTSDSRSPISVNINIFENETCLVEKYVININQKENAYSLERDPYFLKIEDHLRTICLKLSMATAYLKPLDDTAHFIIDVEVSGQAYLSFINSNSASESFPWISTDRVSKSDRGDTLLPVTCIKNEKIALELFIIKK